jgi:hypothetical protein
VSPSLSMQVISVARQAESCCDPRGHDPNGNIERLGGGS